MTAVSAELDTTETASSDLVPNFSVVRVICADARLTGLALFVFRRMDTGFTTGAFSCMIANSSCTFS